MKRQRTSRLDLLRQSAISLIFQLGHELRRLNHGGTRIAASPNASRREQARAFKAALAERYHDHRRCC